ncbi:RNA polymerase II-associated [Schizothecium vesticola]|uniref:RNA polymerase II-associated n=1 Tax=Schizothecium vesticola TaxID=314040 RepID=A0AA40F8M4_9PEZI|nr:RNA polymerase II-associated [Schizothecium vesticola]
MASHGSQSRGEGERMIHQDYIVRIRYSNALPPPDIPPKMLDIPNAGLAQYTNPAFASRLAREQPINIEADAELGMPIDLVGMPGVFDGDESSIQFPAVAPPVHPRDRALLRPLASLGKPKAGDAAVSFLRRTEYISSATTSSRPSTNIFLNKPGGSTTKRPQKRRASPEPDRGTPAWIKRRIEKSFEIAAANLADPSRVKHPTKRGLKVVEAIPLLPDLDAFPDSGSYVTVKFQTNPVSTNATYDTRLLSGIFKPIERSVAEERAFELASAAHERDPAHNPKPSNMMNYDFYLAADAETGVKFRQKFDVDNPGRESPALYTAPDDGGSFRFPRVRAYETSQEKEMDHDTKYDEEVILARREHAQDPGRRAMYYYPIMQRSTIRSQRTKNIARTAGITDEEESHVDELHVQVSEPSDELKAELAKYTQQPVGFLYDDEEEEEGQAAPSRSVTPAAHGNGNAGSDEDAEGDEDDE